MSHFHFRAIHFRCWLKHRFDIHTSPSTASRHLIWRNELIISQYKRGIACCDATTTDIVPWKECDCVGAFSPEIGLLARVTSATITTTATFERDIIRFGGEFDCSNCVGLFNRHWNGLRQQQWNSISHLDTVMPQFVDSGDLHYTLAFPVCRRRTNVVQEWNDYYRMPSFFWWTASKLCLLRWVGSHDNSNSVEQNHLHALFVICPIRRTLNEQEVYCLCWSPKNEYDFDEHHSSCFEYELSVSERTILPIPAVRQHAGVFVDFTWWIPSMSWSVVLARSSYLSNEPARQKKRNCLHQQSEHFPTGIPLLVNQIWNHNGVSLLLGGVFALWNAIILIERLVEWIPFGIIRIICFRPTQMRE